MEPEKATRDEDAQSPSPDADKMELPPEKPFITLSQALTWIAFDKSMGSECLHKVLALESYRRRDPQGAIIGALDQLMALGSAAEITMLGKYRRDQNDHEDSLLTSAIEPVKLLDYRRFSYLDDELRPGEGLALWHEGSASILDYTFEEGRNHSFVQVKVDRAHLLRHFRPRDLAQSTKDVLRCGHTFRQNDPATIAPWWTINQALAWVATRIPSYIEYIGNLEKDHHSEHHPYVVQAICESQVAESDEGKALMESRHASWPAATVLAHAGRVLLEKILAERVDPMTRDHRQGRKMRSEEFVGIGLSETGGDWLDLAPQPLFSSTELMRVFPVGEPTKTRSAITITSTVGAEGECRDWLVTEFEADPEKRRSKDDFRAAALARFDGRLSARGFNERVWPTLAHDQGRSGPGAKRKS